MLGRQYFVSFLTLNLTHFAFRGFQKFKLSSKFLPNLPKLPIFGVCRTPMYSIRAFWKKRPMNHKFDHCVSQKDVMSCCRDIVTSDTSDLYDYPFNVSCPAQCHFFRSSPELITQVKTFKVIIELLSVMSHLIC